jgi:hypothetical protein
MSSAGVASCVVANLGTDNWTVVVQEPSSNGYFTAPNSDPLVITVYQPTTEKFATGGGWVTDLSSNVSTKNRHGNFGLTVRYKSGGTTPTGQAVYVFRGADGYDYVVKSNSWSGGGLSFGINTSGFSGKANVTAINPSSGLAVSGIGGGNYTYRIDVTDNGSTGDTYAISVYTPTRRAISPGWDNQQPARARRWQHRRPYQVTGPSRGSGGQATEVASRRSIPGRLRAMRIAADESDHRP